MERNIELSFKRLSETKEYAFENIFQRAEYDWYGDWEGRALLAFACHYQIHGNIIPCMTQLVAALPQHTNPKLYFGPEFDGITADEQQLSGHSWYLRGLIKYAEAFNDELALKAAKSTVENLYLPIKEWYKKYLLKRERHGGVSGSVTGTQNGWKLSSDVGCAYMCVDGLSHYYAYTKDARVKDFLDDILVTFYSSDYVNNGFQTHTTLSCARGILTLYKTTGEQKYLDGAMQVLRNYTEHGMTLTYENYNWFGRKDSWTEPCAVVDSFILSTELYKLTEQNEYLTLARRIWFNGLQFCQRPNGGAGPNSCVRPDQPVLKVSMYEAAFCCTMRYAEGLLEYSQNKELFSWNSNAEITQDEMGRKFIDDKLLVSFNSKTVPIFSGYELDEDSLKKAELKII